MKVLITGGTGFIGSYVTKILVGEGHDVVCYDLEPDGNALDTVLEAGERQNVIVLQGDVTDPVALMRVISEHRVDTVVHQASLLVPATDASPRLGLRVNSGSLIDLFEAARILKLRRVVWASSDSVYGPRSMYGDVPIPDTAPHGPTTLYGAMKSLNEFIAKHYFDCFGVDNIGLRYTIVYGYGRLRGGATFASELLRKAAIGQPAVVPYADTKFDWQYVEDAALATVMAAKREGPTRTRVFNTGGVVGTGREVAGIVKDLLPEADLSLEQGTLFGSDAFPEYDISGIADEIGFRPGFDLRAGVTETINKNRIGAGLEPLAPE